MEHPSGPNHQPNKPHQLNSVQHGSTKVLCDGLFEGVGRFQLAGHKVHEVAIHQPEQGLLLGGTRLPVKNHLGIGWHW